MWLDVPNTDNNEYDVAVGAVVVNVDNSRIYLVDDDKQVCDVHCSGILFVQLN